MLLIMLDLSLSRFSRFS